jgi:hypothetical protein
MDRTESAPSPAPLRHLDAGIFLCAGSVLLLEVALTRVFAIQMWHHFAYMVVSLALLGFGASGSLLTALRIGERRGGGAATIALFASAYGATLLAVFFVVTRMEVDSLALWTHPGNMWTLLFTYLLLSVPFLLAGCAIGTTLSRHPGRVGRLYFFDLVGSAAGGALAPVLLGATGPVGTVAIAACMALLAGTAYALGATTRTRVITGLLALAGIVVAFLFITGRLEYRIPFAPHKGARSLVNAGLLDRTLPSSTAQVDVFKTTVSSMVIGGQFGDVDWMEVPLRSVTQDGTAPTALHQHSGDLARFPNLDDSQAGSAYQCFEARGTAPDNVLVIGVGGGIDIMVALAHGTRRVVGAEINHAMIRMVTKDYAEYIDHLFDNPRIDLHHAEGRAFLRQTAEQFDVIQLSGVDTYTALSTGAYTLSESYLYTVEAVKDLYARLKPGGIVNYSRFFLGYPARPRETIRLVNIARSALEELGVQEPWRHIAVLQAHAAASTMIKRDPFTEEEMARLRQFAVDQGFMGLVYDPLRPLDAIFGGGRPAAYHYRDAAREALERQGLRLDQVEQVPGFGGFAPMYAGALRHAIAGDLAASDATLTNYIDASGLKGQVRDMRIAGLMESRDAFVADREQHNAAFARVQGDFKTLIKAPEAERRAFIESYLYDLEPTRDDRPFFFNYFKVSRLKDYLALDGTWSREYHPEFPVGHMVLLVSLLQIVLLAIVLIFLPLRRLRRQRVATPRRLRVFLYFAALGIGFMFVEIGLMQKFVLFLGHPTWSLSVVLSGMLFFSGVGAWLSNRIRTPDRRTTRTLLAVIIALIALEVIAVNLLLEPLLSLPLLLRVLTTLLFLAPIGIALGMPFPLGIRHLESHAPVLIPWGWAVNGFLSVFSSMVISLLAMKVGFSAVIGSAAVIYAIGFLLGPFDRQDT